MALVSILVDTVSGTRRGTRFSLKDALPNEKTPILDFTIDATLNETHQYEAEVTENPVEEGVPIADHIDLKPEAFTLTGVISDTPLGVRSQFAGGGAAAGALYGRQILGPLGSYAGVGAGAFANLLASEKNRARNAYDHLRNLQTARVPFTVSTGLHVFENMVLTSLSITRDSKSGRSFTFTATLKRLRIVRAEAIQIKNVPKNVSGANGQGELGKQHAQDTTADRRTLTKQAFDFFKNSLGGKAAG